VRAHVGCDALIYQDLSAMQQALLRLNPSLDGFDASCFDGRYCTGDVDDQVLAAMQAARPQAMIEPIT